MAQRFDLPNRDRKDSQGICFLGKIPFRDFIREHLGEKPGDFVEKATGRVLGQHKGHWFYTVGQRFGLGLSGGPWFVVEKDLEQNRILLANGYEPEEVYARVFEVSRMNWISGAPDLRGSRTLQVRIRHGATLTDCAVPECVADAFRVTLHEPLHGVAEGQFAVFYDGEVCLGGGMIASVVRD
jgi:tRNA-specific 2-thiouridylase